MIVFWWTGKGYLTPLILLLTLMLFGLVLDAGRSFLHDSPAYWGTALIGAGLVNWYVGRRQNARKLATVRSAKIRHRLIYRARNKFLSLPFEVWSIPLVIVGLVMIGNGLLNQSLNDSPSSSKQTAYLKLSA